MTKNKLIQKLNKIHGDPLVILASDAEGNSYSSVSEIYTDKDMRWDDDNREIVDEQDVEEEDFDKMDKCIILFPE
jgi:hypothetical protein